MAVMAEQKSDAVAPEAVAQLLGASGGATQVATHQGGGDDALGTAGEHGAAVEVGGVDGRRLAVSQRGGRGQSRPALREGAGGGPERSGPFRGRQRGPAPARRGGGRAAVDLPVQAGHAQPRLSLDAGELGGADGPGELAIATAMASEQAKTVATVEVDLGPDDGANPGAAGRLHEADDAVEPVPVAQPQRLDPQCGGGGHQGAW